MLFNVCDANPPDEFGPGRPPYGFSVYAAYTFAPAIANSWRPSRDLGQPGHMVFADVLANLNRDALHRNVAGPGHWNDPDYLVPGEGMARS
jgi:alpha-galactosidase